MIFAPQLVGPPPPVAAGTVTLALLVLDEFEGSVAVTVKVKDEDPGAGTETVAFIGFVDDGATVPPAGEDPIVQTGAAPQLVAVKVCVPELVDTLAGLTKHVGGGGVPPAGVHETVIFDVPLGVSEIVFATHVMGEVCASAGNEAGARKSPTVAASAARFQVRKICVMTIPR